MFSKIWFFVIYTPMMIWISLDNMELLEIYREALRVRTGADLGELFRSVTQLAVEKSAAESATVWIARPDERKLYCQAVYFRGRGHESPCRSYGYDEIIEGQIVQKSDRNAESIVVIDDPENDARMLLAGRNTFSNILVAPLFEEHGRNIEVIGTLTLLNTPAAFSKDAIELSRELAAILGNVSFLHRTQKITAPAPSAAIEKKDRGRQYRLLKTRHEEYLLDLKLAGRVQRLIWRSDIQPPEGYRIAKRFRPSRFLGGDLVTSFTCGNGKYGIVIADVSGSGVAACLVATYAREVFRQNFLRQSAPEVILRNASEMIESMLPEVLYVTAIVAILDPRTHTIDIACAGHPPPIRIKDGKAEEIPATGEAIGLSDENRFHCCRYQMQPKERILFYTDGIVEISGQDDESFGHDRLIGLTESKSELEIDNLADLILKAGEVFAGSNRDFDDQSLMILERI